MPPIEQLPKDLLSILSQPLPVGRVKNNSLHDVTVKLNGMLFLEPSKVLQSTMRALMLVKQVLEEDGHVLVANSNPAFQPLMQHAARCSLNSNMWWMSEPYSPGTLLLEPQTLLKPASQPARGVTAGKGIQLSNPHCPQRPLEQQPPPRLDTLDRWRLWGKRREGGRDLLRGILRHEEQAAKLRLPGAGHQQAAAPTLVVVLDLSYGLEMVEDAHEAGILTSSVVNAHSPLIKIMYPIYAAEANPAYTHFFLNWLLKVSNLPAPPAASLPTA